MTLADDIALLLRVPLFSDLSGDPLRLLAFSAIHMELPAGQILFDAGARATSGFVIIKGEIGMSNRRGESVVELGRYGPGVLLGESALFTETTRPATATALVDCELVEIDGALVRRMLTEYPEVAVKLFGKLRNQFAGTLAEIGGIVEKLDALRYPGAA